MKGKTMKEIFLTLAIPILLILSGCSHNVVTYGDGIGFDMGVDPEHFSASFTLRYGKTLTAITRDNVEIELAGKANADGVPASDASTNVGTDGNLRVKIGRQINGYAVDLVEAGADPDKVVEALSDK